MTCPCCLPSRAKQLAALQASIHLIQSGKAVVGATGELIQLRPPAPSATARIESPGEEEVKAGTASESERVSSC